MPEPHDKSTIASMAVIAMGTAVLLHEGVGHGITAWLLGAGPTELTSSHLDTVLTNRLVAAGGTLVNLIAGVAALDVARIAGKRANRRYFFWLLAAMNLFPAAGYFLFSGVLGVGDWQQVIDGWSHQARWRIGMTMFGGALYLFFALLLAVEVRPFVRGRGEYNVVGRMPYLVGCLFSCAAGALDPLGLKLFLISTVPAAFGGSSGMLWLDGLMPNAEPGEGLVVRRSPAWWVAAAVFGVAYILILGRGIKL